MLGQPFISDPTPALSTVYRQPRFLHHVTYSQRSVRVPSRFCIGRRHGSANAGIPRSAQDSIFGHFYGSRHEAASANDRRLVYLADGHCYPDIQQFTHGS